MKLKLILNRYKRVCKSHLALGIGRFDNVKLNVNP